MAKRLVFATTWWAQKWKQALEDVDYANRLPRGRNYYASGRVLEVKFDPDTNAVHAVIQGSAYAPYEASIAFSRLPRTDVERLVAAIGERPDLCARLLQNTLDPEVAAICEHLGIELFPHSWRDMDMHCSCPDSAVPCKHLAAVYYAIVKTIDADPMWVFTIRGINLPEELKKAGLDLAQSTSITEPDLSAIAAGLSYAAPEKTNLDLAALPYYRLPELRTTLLRLVPDNGGKVRYRSVLAALYEKLQRAAQLLLDHEKSTEAWDKAKAMLRVSELTPQLVVDTENTHWKAQPQATRTLNKLGASCILGSAASFPPDEPANVSWRHLCSVVDLALHLAARGAVVPLLTRAGTGFRIRWLPALQDRMVAELVGAAALADTSSLVTLAENAQFAFTSMGRVLLLLEAVFAWLLDSAVTASTAVQQDPASAALYLRGDLALGEERTLRDVLAPLALSTHALSWTPVVILRTGRDREKITLNLGAQKKAGRSTRPTLYRDLQTQSSWAQERLAAAAVFSSLGNACPNVREVVRSGGKPSSIALEDLAPVLFDAVPALEFLGARVMLPQSLSRLLRPTLRAQISGSSTGQGMITAANLAKFSWQIALGDNAITAEEFAQLTAQAGKIVAWKDDFVYLDPKVLARIQAELDRKNDPSYLEKLRGVLSGQMDGIPVEISANLQERLAALTQQEDIAVPTDLQAHLRPYQERGYSWLVKNTRLGLGSLIADDMGLGKTLQVIALLLAMKHAGDFASGKVLAVVPTTLLVNWQREIARFAPALTVHIYHGPKRELEKDGSRSDITLTSYGTFRRDSSLLGRQAWRLLVIDEAQAAKNAGTALAQALRDFATPQVVAMSGTPVENNLLEYWSLFSIVQPGLLGSADDFRKNLALPIESDHDPEALAAFHKLTAPFMLRRLKTDKNIIADLPDKVVRDTFVRLTPEQAALYQHNLEKLLTKIADAEAEGDKAHRAAMVLKLLTSLKQICNSPSQFEKTTVAAPDSGKAQLLLDLLQEARQNHRKVLVFTQYREMGERLQNWIAADSGIRPDFLHGGVTPKERVAMVDRFQNDPSVPVLLISLKAGGTGLNLTAASIVIHYDLWWNPAVENQATDRAYRIGQKQNVQVYRLICAGTFEEKINEILQKKQELSDLTVATGEAWVGDLPAAELKNLFGLTQKDNG